METKGSQGLLWVDVGLVAWHRAGSREDRCEGREMTARQRAQLGHLQQLFLLPSSTAVVTPQRTPCWGSTSRSCCASLREAQTQSRDDSSQADLFVTADTYGAAFARYIALAKQKVMQSCWQRKGGGASFCFLCSLCCLNRTRLKPKEMCTDENMHMKTGRSCSAGHWGAVQMVSSVILFLRAQRCVLTLCHSYSLDQNPLLLMFGS